jgi:hypothetical protein
MKDKIVTYCEVSIWNGWEKTTESLSQDSWFPSRDLNWISPPYKTDAPSVALLLLHLHRIEHGKAGDQTLR